MSAEKRPLKVFLCHAHTDRDPVRVLYLRLKKDGVDAWIDKEKLIGGQDWEYEIRKTVRESDVVIVCHSKQFNQKGFRQKEVKIALEEAALLPKGEIFIIPVRLEECEVLDDLIRWHWVDLFEKEGYESLIRALRVRADKIGATLQIRKSWMPNITTPRNQRLGPVKEVKVLTVAKADESKPMGLQKNSKSNKSIVFWVIGIIAVILMLSLPSLFEGISPDSSPTPSYTSLPDTFTPSLPSQILSPNESQTLTPTKLPPSLTPTPDILQYFTDDFANGIKNWSYFLSKGTKEKFSLSLEQRGLVFNLAAKRIYAYLVYEPVTYEDVRIDVHTENFGVNENNVTMFCRYTPGAGWYEFNIFNNGLYNISFTKLDTNGTLKYSIITNGGSNGINQGHTVNEYSAICKGSTLTLYINGVLTKTVDAAKYELSAGKVGFSVSSFDIVPVQVSLDWIRISKP